MSLDTIAAALTDATPILAGTAWPALTITAGVAIWCLTQPDTDDDDHNVDDYKPATTTRATTYRYQPAADDRTQTIPRVWPDGGTPLYDQLTAAQTAREWLRDIAANHAFVNGVNVRNAL